MKKKRGVGLIILLFIFCPSPLLAKESFFSKEVTDYRRIGYLAYKEGDLDKAHQFFKKAVLLEPKNSILHNDLGIIYERRGLRELAIKEYLEAISLDPNYCAPYMNLALLYNDLGEKEKAVFYLKERVRLAKKRDHWYEKAMAMLKRYEEEMTSLSTGENRTALFSPHSLKDNFLRWEGKSTGIKEDKPVLNEIEKVYQEGMQALSEGNFGLVMEKIDYLLKFNPVDNGDIDFFSRAEKEKFIQETREEEPIVLSFP